MKPLKVTKLSKPTVTICVTVLAIAFILMAPKTAAVAAVIAIILWL